MRGMRPVQSTLTRRELGTHRPDGLTLVEVLIAVALVAVVVWLLVPRRDPTLKHGRRLGCANKLRELHKGTLAYRDAYGGFFPLAWHVHGSSIADDLSNLTFARFAIYEQCDPTFNHIVTPQEVEQNVGLLPARQLKYNLTRLFWKCPTKGWTDDYFAPEIVFSRSDTPVRETTLTQALPADQRPLFADVNASAPQPYAEHLKDPGHNHELRYGFAMTTESRTDVFIGVGPSLRVLGNLLTTRLDYRHGAAANVIFLDGHADAFSPDDPRLEALHRAWNYPSGKPQEN